MATPRRSRAPRPGRCRPLLRRTCCPPSVGTPSPTSLSPVRSFAPHLGPPPLPCLTRLCFKRNRPGTALSSFSSLALLRPWPSMHASHPRRRPSNRGPRRVSDRRHPPTVRPTNPPPFPYSEPPSPLLSSPAALEASRSRRRPSLQEGPRRAPPH
jgi:hypothetical protein